MGRLPFPFRLYFWAPEPFTLHKNMADEGAAQVSHDAELQSPAEAAKDASSDSSEAEAAAVEKGKRVLREWEILGSWDPTTEESSFINSELERIATEKMAAGGITKLAYLRTSATDLGQWKVKDVFESSETGSKIIRYQCPLKTRCKCPALLKVVHSQTLVRIFMSQMHDTESHAADKDKSKYLNWQQKNEVKAHVLVDPLASAAQMRRNLHRTSPQKKIPPALVRYDSFSYLFLLSLLLTFVSLLRSVAHLVRETRHDLTRQLLGLDADPDESPANSYAAARLIFVKHDFKTAMKAHKLYCETRGGQGRHLAMCDILCLHHEVDGGQELLFAAFSSVWQLLGLARQINSGWPIVLHCDASFKLCRLDISMVTIGFNTLGGRYRNAVASLNGGGRETKQSYEVSYNAMRSAFHIVCTLPTCHDQGCKPCSALRFTVQHAAMRTHLASDLAKVSKSLPVVGVTADSGKAVAAFATLLKVPRLKCFNHITGTSSLHVHCCSPLMDFSGRRYRAETVAIS